MRDCIAAKLPKNFELIKFKLENPFFEQHGFQYEIKNPCRYYDQVSEGTGWWSQRQKNFRTASWDCWCRSSLVRR